MADITMAVGLTIMAACMSLVLAGRIDLQASRRLTYVAGAIIAAHAIGVRISAPLTPEAADRLDMATLAWAGIAILGLAGRGLSRILADRRSAAIGD